MNLKSLIISSIFVSLFLPSAAISHPGGHEQQVSEKNVISIASKHVSGLIAQKTDVPGIGILDKRWIKVDEYNKKITKKGAGYYIVSFNQPEGEKTLYLLISSAGDLYDANFMGNFQEID